MFRQWFVHISESHGEGAIEHLAPGTGSSCPRDGARCLFLVLFCYFSNATHLDCQFAEINFAMGNIHISVYNTSTLKTC